jgi:hypothetical protein
MIRTAIRTALTPLLLCLPICGCSGTSGPEMGEVSGTVKLDGQPLANASVRFTPESGAPSIGITDEQGYYELQYSSSRNGAVAGQHVVRISTHRHAGEDDDGNKTPAVPEKVPTAYNLKAAENPEMKREVKSGSNTIDFDLKSEGEIVQPANPDA